MIPVETTFSNADPESKFTTVQGLISILNQLISSQITDDITPYVVGSTTPSVDDQDKVWHRKDSIGRPIGTYVFYNGTWRRQYSGLFGEIKPFFGDPVMHFESNGIGIVGGFWDGWALMDGQGGRANMNGKVLIGGNAFDIPTQLWTTDIRGVPETFLGEAEVTLTDATTFQPDVAAIRATHWDATGAARNSGGGMYGSTSGSDGSPFDLVPASGNSTPDPVSIIQPAFALALCQFIGY